MALSDKPTRAELRTSVQLELMDTAARWWSAAEINGWLDEWLNEVNQRHEVIWGSATFTNTGTETVTLATVAPGMLRLDAVYWDDRRLAFTTTDRLELIRRAWRDTITQKPRAIYQPTADTLAFWPAPVAGTGFDVVFEYPRDLTFAADTSTLELPAWAKFSAIQWGGHRAYLRRGPNFDGLRSARYKAIFKRQLDQVGKTFRQFMPKRSTALRPATAYEAGILNPVGTRLYLE